ncbi:MAG: 23S rRNA methyltransferase [Desulfobulbaceae bacterium A2]|nr:MAG: 23S rRNA methyltransferase [Desulfobulbaceae bacterium A2]
MENIILKPGRERSLLRHHPWVFSGAIARIEGEPSSGATVAVRAADGSLLGQGAYSPASQIRVRMWNFAPEAAPDCDFFRRRLHAALALRDLFPLPQTGDGWRLVHAEADGLPGLVVDRYGDTLVLQAGSAGVEYWKETIADLLLELTPCRGIIERSDGDNRLREGLDSRIAPLRGEPAGCLTLHEHGLAFQADLFQGHKTGFYLDQRDNRALVRTLAAGREVLDCFCYSGGFAINCLAGGAASVLAVDSSAEALQLAEANRAANSLPAERLQLEQADVFQHLRRLRDGGRSFGLIILDPPKFAATAAQAERAARGYKDINLLACKLLAPGGLLATFSCSGGIDPNFFQKIVASAAADAGLDLTLLRRLGPGPDHPIALACPESDYLKGLLCLRPR